MASSVPKPAATRQRRNRHTTAALLEAGPATKLPLPENRTWHPRTVATWDVWWASPIAAEWVDAFVPGLLELLELVDDFHKADTAIDRAKLRSEIRLSSREYGLSPLSMRQLQWEIKRVQAAGRTPVAPVRRRRSAEATLGVLQGGRSQSA